MGIRTIALVTTLAMTVVSTQAKAATLIVDVAGASAASAFGGAGNTVQAFTLGAGSRVTAISYDVSITANDPSFLSEASVALFPTGRTNVGVSLNPGAADDFSGTSAYIGAVDLAALGLEFTVGGDGILRLEYFDAFVDGALPDSNWNSGTITVTYDAVAAAVPEPAAWGTMFVGLAFVGGTMRRRARISSLRHA